MGDELLVVDAHVHFHDCFDATRFLDAASAHFQAAAGEQGQPLGLGCLLFTESAWDHQFRRFRDAPDSLGLSGWSVETTQEPGALLARQAGERRLAIVAGRQLVTREGLEVLALGTDREFPDGLGTREALAAARASGAVPVLPWGFGKWWGKRGRRLREIVEASRGEELFLGDNGGRPRLSWSPPAFALGREKGIRVLPGTDPLPFRRENTTAGSYGFLLEGRIDPARPAASIKTAIREHYGGFRVFGRRERLLPFFRNQVAMQVVKRRTA